MDGFKMKFFLVLLLCYGIFVDSSQNTKLLEIEKNKLSEAMKEFIGFIVNQNYNEKDGFCLILINKIQPEYLNFAAKTINKKSSIRLINFDINKTMRPVLNSHHHFKLVFTDPEGELSHAEDSFKKVRISRAPVVLILTKKPLEIFIRYLFNSYKKINSLNVILAYEYRNTIKVFSFNPYLPGSETLLDLTLTKYTHNLFEDKTTNLHGTNIKALLTYPDRTKIKKSLTGEYEGKDFVTISTIVENLNGNLIVLNMDNILFNPWYESLDIANRSELKKKIMAQRDIAVFVKSDTFSIDDEIVDNLYPHTQNDLIALVPKSSAVSFTRKILQMFTFTGLLLALTVCAAFTTTILLIKTSKTSLPDYCFVLYRLMAANNFTHLPRNKLERILLFGFLCYFFLINLFIVSKASSFLTVTPYNPEIDTIDQMLSSGLQPYAIPNHIEELKKKYLGTEYENYIKSFRNLPMNEGLFDYIFFTDQKDFYPYLTEHDIGVFVSRFKNFRRNGAPIYHLVKESLIPNYQSYKVPHTSPLLNIFNRKLRRLEEGGFIELWARRALENATIRGELSPPNGDESVNVTKPISLNVIEFAFFFLVAGLLISIITFFVEIIKDRKIKQTTKTT